LDAAPLDSLHAGILAGVYGNVDRMVVIRNGYLVRSERYPRDYAEIARGRRSFIGGGEGACDGFIAQRRIVTSPFLLLVAGIAVGFVFVWLYAQLWKARYTWTVRKDTGAASLSARERRVRNAVGAGRVAFLENRAASAAS
jgi:hypothetical protein